MKSFVLIFITLLVWLCSCKKDCVTCVNWHNLWQFDSIVNVSYDTIHHRNDTSLVRIDTVMRGTGLKVVSFCAGSSGYDKVTAPSAELYYWDSTGEYICQYDQ